MNSAAAQVFETLKAVAVARLGAGHAVSMACVKAAETGAPADAHLAQEALAQLPPGALADLMAEVHKTLREDVGLVMEFWGPKTHPT